MRAVCDEMKERDAAEGGVVRAGEGVEVSKGKAAPWGAEDGECGDAVRGMEQRTGECGEVEHLLTVAQGLDVEGAEGDGVAAERRDDLREMDAAAHEDGDAPGHVAAGRERSIEPVKS